MKRIYSVVIAVLFGVLASFAEQIKVQDIALVAGNSTTVEIGLENAYTNLVAFQMDLTLPEGIGIDKAGCKLSSRITDEDQVLTIGRLSANTYRLTSTSLSLKPISGTSGTLLTLKLTSAANFVNGQVTFSNVLFSTATSQEVAVADASFTINTLYNLTYQVDGQVYKTSSVAYGTALTPENAPTKEGYTFSGWSEIPATMPANDVVVTGTFSVSNYTLTYKVDGEVYKTSSVAYGTELTPENAPTKEGYTFSGWSEIPATMPASDVVITGTFSVNNYTLTYKVDGEVYKTSSVAYGTALTPENAPTKEGYTFSGWSEIPATMPANDVVVTGTFSVNNYTLTYKVDGEVYKTSSVAYGTTLTPENAPTKEGYTFSGWSEIPATMPANDIVVTGTFSINQYTMTFVLDNGEEYLVKKQDYASALTAPENLVKTGFTFKGWSPAVPATVPASDMTFTAQWERNKYLVTFIVEDTVVKKDSVLYEGTITKPADPMKEGYTFSGWSEIPATMPANDVVITGTFKVNTYAVTFMYNDKVLKVDSVEYGAKITLPTSLDDERYALVEWLDVPETMPAHDITIYASITDGIRNVSDEIEYKIYDERGQQILRMKRGLNIIKYSNGRIRKVIVK